VNINLSITGIVDAQGAGDIQVVDQAPPQVKGFRE
jgi:hypothetical protein